MKRFQMVTEADARSLEYGSAIVLVAGGHITPLALDTLKARRITIVRDSVDVDVETLAPPAQIRTVAIAGDHTSVAMKAAILTHLRGRGFRKCALLGGGQIYRAFLDAGVVDGRLVLDGRGPGHRQVGSSEQVERRLLERALGEDEVQHDGPA